MMPKKIAIIGVGLIGGSLGFALKKKKARDRRRLRIIGAGRHAEKLVRARRLGAVDAWTTDFTKAAMESDIVVICAPVLEISPIAKKIIPWMKPGAILTDAGSVKAEITKNIDGYLSEEKRRTGRKIFFVGAHPLAGSEKTGVENGSEDLYEGATVVLTPSEASSPEALREIRKMWESAGALIKVMDAKKHDKLVASTSHLPHALSAALVRFINRNRPDFGLVAGSFRDMTRISDSDPEGWAGICRMNAGNLSSGIAEFIKELETFRKLLGGKKLAGYFEKARKERWQLLKSNRKKKSVRL